MKKTLYSELAYLFGIMILALGTAFMERADFGVSMVVAPAYLIYLKLSTVLPFFTFGMAEYIFQAILLIVMIIVIRKFRWSYLFSFITAVLYGFTLDGCMWVVSFIPAGHVAIHIGMYVIGLALSATGVALFFRTYIAPEVYELFVKEVSAKYNFNISHVKTAYDCTSCVVAVIMSFAFFGLWHFKGVGIGTVICALINGTCIGLIGKLLNRYFEPKEAFGFRKFFE